jgi:hypothetical protein
VDLPQRSCSFVNSSIAAHVPPAAGSFAPSRREIFIPHHSRAAATARVSFFAVTIESQDRYSAQMTLPTARRTSVRRSITSLLSLS